jgi:hypothetical protein
MRLIAAAAKFVTDGSSSVGRGASAPAGVVRGRLPRQHMIETIIRTTPGVSSDFLARFGDDALRHYLDRLNNAAKPRGREAFWIRRPETAAFNAFEPVM